MIIKQFFQGKTYRETLLRRLWLFLSMTFVGVLLIVLSLTVVKGSDLPDHIQGFYLGAGCGLTLCSVCFIASHLRLLRDPAAAKKAQVSEEDEREQAIVRSSMITVFWVCYVVTTAGIFIALPLNAAVSWTLAALMVLMTVSLILSIAWHKRHM